MLKSKFKIGQKIKLPTKTKNEVIRICYEDPSDPHIEMRQFNIIGKNDFYEEFLVKIDPDMIGFTISNFHIEYSDVAKEYLGSRFVFVDSFTIERYNA